MKTQERRPAIYGRIDDGHRSSYFKTASDILGASRVGVWEALLTSRPVLFLMIEENFVLYISLSIIRAILGNRTVGLLFRPKPTIEGKSLRLVCKRTVLRSLKLMKLSSTLTILPLSINQKFSEIARDGIYDFQLWDLNDLDRQRFCEVRTHRERKTYLFSSAAVLNRKIVASLGAQNMSKGFDRFTRIFCEYPEIRERFLFVAAGEIRGNLLHLVSPFEEKGGLCISRQLSDQELIDMYAASDIVWSSYEKSYDQASGILGRAVQLGLPVIVREGSLLQALCESERFPHVVQQDSDGLWRDFPHVPSNDERGSKQVCVRMRKITLDTIERALYGNHENRFK